MATQQIAVISDIHGNSFALSEVLKDIKARGIETIINLGDSLYGPLDPKGTFDLLNRSSVISIAGNQDRAILESLNSKSESITLEYVKSQLDKRAIDWLRLLPFDMVFDEKVYCCHASPQSDTAYLLERLEPDHVAVKDKKEIDSLLKDIKQRIVICGHSHVPKIVETGSKLIVNSGSVGLPAYDDDLPVYHKMENYNPRSSYVVLSMAEKLVKVDRVAVDYDYEKAACLAELNERNDWARWIRTGVV